MRRGESRLLGCGGKNEPIEDGEEDEDEGGKERHWVEYQQKSRRRCT
jgi:hypothetical protein